MALNNLIQLPMSVKCVDCEEWKTPRLDQVNRIAEHTWICAKCKAIRDKLEKKSKNKR